MYLHGGITDEKLLDFSANINFLGMPQKVREAAILGVMQSERYPDPQCHALKEVAATYHTISPEMIVFGNGASELIYGLFLALQPKRVLMHAPIFQEYVQAATNVGAKMTFAPLKREQDFLPDEAILEEITPEISLVVLVQPNNPTGHMLKKELFSKILKRCEACGCHLLIDESFLELVDEEKQYSCIPLLQEHPCLIALKSLTKLYALPGLRIGYVLSAEEKLIQKMENILPSWNVSYPAQEAGCACFLEDNFVRETRMQLFMQKKNLLNQLLRFPIKVYGHDANFIFFEGPTSLGEKLKKMGIVIRDCSNFRGLKEGDYRICVRGETDNRRLIEELRALIYHS